MGNMAPHDSKGGDSTDRQLETKIETKTPTNNMSCFFDKKNCEKGKYCEIHGGAEKPQISQEKRDEKKRIGSGSERRQQ